MSIVNTDKILYGSDQKVFDHAYNMMMSDYNENTASDFFESYKNKSLLFILKNSEKIIKEPKFGTGFFMDIIKSGYIPFHMISNLITIVEKIINDGKMNKISDSQLYAYEQVLDALKVMSEEYRHTIMVSEIACKEGGQEFIEQFYDYIYDIKEDGCEDEFFEVLYSLNGVCNPFVIVTLMVFVTSVAPEENGAFMNHLQTFIDPNRIYSSYGFDENSTIRDKKKFSYDAIKAIQMVSKDETILKDLNKGNINAKYMWMGIAQSEIPKPVLQESSNDSFPIFSSSDLLDRLVTESEEDSNSFEEATRKINAYEYLNDLYAYYESMKDMAYRVAFCEGVDVNDSVIESYNNAIDEIGGKLAMMEWTSNGEPDSVIKKHIMTQKQIDSEKSKKEDEKQKAKKEAYKKVADEEEEEEEEDVDVLPKEVSNIRKKILDLSKRACGKVDGCSSHTTKKGEKDFVDGVQNDFCLGSFKPEHKKNVISEVEKALSDYSNDTTVYEDNYNTIYVKIKPSSDYYLEATTVNSDGSMELNGEDENSNVKPEKPKEDLPTRVQNKAIDHAAKRAEKKAIRKEKMTKLKNAGKAVSAGPSDDAKEAKNFLQKFGEWDIKRRKEFFLKPGYRHKIFRNVRHALMYGIAGIHYLPHLLLIRHFSKDKDRRLRNELIRELDAEIKITEEKINDANSNGDQKEKYKLMRIKEKLSAEKNRVQVNSKYI